MQNNEFPTVEWENLTKEDQERTIQFLDELNKIFDSYKEDDTCEDSILDD